MHFYIHHALKFTFPSNGKDLNLCLIACTVFFIFFVLIKILYYLILFLGKFKSLTGWIVSYDIFLKFHTDISS